MLHNNIGFWGKQKEFYFGIGGGAFISAQYNPSQGGITRAAQVQLVKDCGGKVYRIGLTPDDAGVLDSIETGVLNSLVTAANDLDMILLPMVRDRMFSSVWNGTEQQAYDSGYIIMHGTVTNYGHLFPEKIYELSNEIELFRDLREELDEFGEPTGVSMGAGTLAEHYNSRLPNAVQYIAGMEAGCKAADPQARTMFNSAWYAPVYMMDQVFIAAPTIDICAIHWYNEMQGLWNGGTYPGGQLGAADIVEYAYNRWGKPCWITEAGSRWNRYTTDTDTEKQQRQLDYFIAFYDICKNSPYCIGYSIHELLQVIQSDDDYGSFWFPGVDYEADPPDYAGTITPRLLGQYLLTTTL